MVGEDFFSLHALLAVFGWAVATGMAIRHLQHVEENRLLSLVLISLCVVGIAGTWIKGAREHADSRAMQDGIDIIAKAVTIGTASPDQILAAAAAKIKEQGEQLDSANERLSALEHPPRDNDAWYQRDKIVAQVRGAIISEKGCYICYGL